MSTRISYAPHWSDPPPIVIDDDEKNEAVNRIAAALAARARKEARDGSAPALGNRARGASEEAGACCSPNQDRHGRAPGAR